MVIKDIIRVIEEVAPLSFQESYDNSGVQIGSVDREATGALLCLDLNESVIKEAVELGCNLIICHHPILFKGLKRVSGATYEERCVIQAIKNDITVYASHTAMDAASKGLNNHFAKLLGLSDCHLLKPEGDKLVKLATFVPLSHAEKVRRSLFEAGAGHIGNYDSCSYNVQGVGTFRAGEGTHPYCGSVGNLHEEPEIRIETIFPNYKEAEVLAALKQIHPYEEPAYDLFPLKNKWEGVGIGVVGELAEPQQLSDFLNMLKEKLNLEVIQTSKPVRNVVRKVALCGGSGAFLLRDAIKSGADIFVTGEAKYNDFYDAQGFITLATIGHYESEVIIKELFCEIIIEKFPNFAVHFSNQDINPINYI